VTVQGEAGSLTVDIWSDVVCPWCSIGKAHLGEALSRFEHADRVSIVWHSFELDPSAPRVAEGALVDALSRKYGRSRPQAQAMLDQMTDRAARLGLEFRFDRARSGNTFDAHRLIHLGGDRGRQLEVKARFFRAYLAEGEAIGDSAALERLAVEAGLDAAEVRAVLASDRYADAVRADEATARRLGVSGVPFFVFDGRLGVSGAQPPEVLLDVLRKAWSSRPAVEMVGGGDACGPDGCDV
jgi:predicted DsbA family dithiol-disulfide isomerase